MIPHLFIALLLLVSATPAFASESSTAHAHYIANMGAMIERNGTKILFDPLFRNDYDIYDLPARERTDRFPDQVPQPFH